MSGFRKPSRLSAALAIVPMASATNLASESRPSLELLSNLGALITTKLGRCARCIRLSMLFAILGWSVAAITNLWSPSSPVATGAFIAGLGFTSLFLSHMAAFAARVFLRPGRATQAWHRWDDVAAGQEAELAEDRRRFLVKSLKMIGIGLVAVAVPSVLASDAMAAKDCICTCKGCHGTMPGHCPGAKACDYMCWLNCQG